MFTTLAETYMTASRVEAMFPHRMAESERLHLMRIRDAEKRAWIAEQESKAARLRRRALVRGVLHRIGRGLERIGAGLVRTGHALAARQEPDCC